MGECLHSTPKIIALWILQCVGATTCHRWTDRNGGPTQWLWWIFMTWVGLGEGGLVKIFVNGEKSMDAA